MLLGGYVGDMEIEFGEKAAKLPAKAASEAVVRVVGKFAAERQRRRDVPRPGSTAAAAPRPSARRSPTSTSSPTPDEHPDFYVDFGETGPYVAEVGDSECAT